MDRKKCISITRVGRVVSLIGVLVAALSLAGLAHAAGISGPNAIDSDGNGYYDAYIREPSVFSAGNVGAACSYSQDSSGRPTGKITVRPPAVWPINGLSSQQVAWRMVAFSYSNPSNQTTYAPSNWTFGTAYSNQAAEFGGGGDGYPFYVSSTAYWAGSQSWTRSNPAGDQRQPGVQIAWQNPNTGSWTTQLLLVHHALIGGAAIPVC
jgi:hypothetical protein